MTFKKQVEVTEIIQFIQTYGGQNAYLQQSDPTTTIAIDAIKYAICQLVERHDLSNYIRTYKTTNTDLINDRIGFTTDAQNTTLNIVIEDYIPIMVRVKKDEGNSPFIPIQIQEYRPKMSLEYNNQVKDLRINIPGSLTVNNTVNLFVEYMDATISNIINSQNENMHGKQLWMDELEIQYIKLIGAEYFLSVYNQSIPQNHNKLVNRVVSSLTNRSPMTDSYKPFKGI